MKDKKTIAIVTLAAITAGFAIFSFANNNNKLKAYSKLEAEKNALDSTRQKVQTERDELRTQRDQLDVHGKSLEEKVTVQAGQITELSEEVEKQKEETSLLGQQITQKTDEIESMKLQYAQDLGEAEAKLKVAADDLTKVQGELKIQIELATAKIQEAKERNELVLNLESKNKDLNIEKVELEQERVKLQAEIDKTNKLLEESQGSREALKNELAVLEEAKAELDRQMADIFFIEARYKAIKSELAIARRLDWMRRGVGVYKNRKPKGYARSKNLVDDSASTEAKTEGQEVAGESSGNGSESVSVELTSDGRVIIDGKVVEPAQTEKPINPPKE